MKDGIYTNDQLSIEAYHANSTHDSSTLLKKAYKNLALYKMYKDELLVNPHKTCFDFGNALELMLTNKDEFYEKVAIYDDTHCIKEIKENRPKIKVVKNTKQYQYFHDNFMNANKGKYIINSQGEESKSVIDILVEKCNRHSLVSKIFEKYTNQPSIFWTDKETGWKLKTRPDMVIPEYNIVIDIKSAKSADPLKWNYDANDNMYPLQAIVQIEGVEQGGLMKKVEEYYWLVLEKNPPYSVELFKFEDHDRQEMEYQYRTLLNRLSVAKNKNIYPSYGDRLVASGDNEMGVHSFYLNRKNKIYKQY